MPSILEESVLTLSEAARELPSLDGKRIHTSTLWRCCRKSIRGVWLEYVGFGGRLATSKEALVRFAEAITAAEQRRHRL